MNIALCHFRVGETDGVSLEMEKWKLILERMGHTVYFVAGSMGSTEAYVIEEMHYAHPENDLFVKNAYGKLEEYTEETLIEAIEAFAKKIEDKLIQFIEDKQIDIIMPNNIWSLGWGLPAGIGFTHAVKKTKTRCIAHHHDFYWERDKYSHPTCEAVHAMLDTYFPPRTPFIQHCVINNIAKDQMKKRKGIDAKVVPNVFDFDADLWVKDDYNSDFRERIGLGRNDILLLQGTRITERKAIEMAIDVAIRLKKNLQGKDITLYDGRTFGEGDQVVLVLAGLFESETAYVDQLKAKAEAHDLRLVFCNDVVEHSREIKNDKKCYSLWDAYVDADFITYPSILEGWGNQFLEGLFAKKPMLVYEYPVYLTDIKTEGFHIVSLGSEGVANSETGLIEVADTIIDKAALEMEALLTDNDLREQQVEENFQIGKREFSYDSLERRLRDIL